MTDITLPDHSRPEDSRPEDSRREDSQPDHTQPEAAPAPPQGGHDLQPDPTADDATGSDATMTIRQMCDTFGVTARTLRFYESKELLAPHRDGQKRLYTKRDRARLKLILRGKRFGFPLEEIRQLLDLYDIGDQQITQYHQTMSRAKVHLEKLKRQRRELDEVIGELSDQIAWGARMLETREEGAPPPDPRCEM